METYMYGDKEIDLETKDFDSNEIKQQQQEKYIEYINSQKEYPDCGTTFLFNEQIFKIKYINLGKKRISAEWIEGEQFKNPELDSTCSIHGKIYKVTYCNESRRRINIEPI